MRLLRHSSRSPDCGTLSALPITQSPAAVFNATGQAQVGKKLVGAIVSYRSVSRNEVGGGKVSSRRYKKAKAKLEPKFSTEVRDAVWRAMARADMVEPPKEETKKADQ